MRLLSNNRGGTESVLTYPVWGGDNVKPIASETLSSDLDYLALPADDEKDSGFQYFQLNFDPATTAHHWRLIRVRHCERVLRLGYPEDIRSTAFDYFLESGVLRSPVVVEEHAFREAEALAYRDRLTGLFNYAYFEQQLEVEVARARRYETPICLILLDLDGFKFANDRFGHSAGNSVLRDAGRLLRGALRQGDIVARLGGDEFAILLHHSDLEAGLGIAQRKRRAIERWFRRCHCRDVPLSITASFGVSDRGSSAGELFDSADTALYRAKERGRNRVEAARIC